MGQKLISPLAYWTICGVTVHLSGNAVFAAVIRNKGRSELFPRIRSKRVSCGVVALRLALILLGFALVDTAQNRTGDITGSLITRAGEPIGQARVEARGQSRPASVRYATSGADGSYVLSDLPPGVYNLKITAMGFREVEIPDVEIDKATGRRLSVVLLEVGDLIVACGTDRRPDYYLQTGGTAQSAAVGGLVMTEKATPVRGATVTLYMEGKGRIAAQKTTHSGTFRFTALQMQSQEYWITIEYVGFFLEEVRHLSLLPGYEAVYSPISIESCRPGHCQPNLKTVRVLPFCA